MTEGCRIVRNRDLVPSWTVLRTGCGPTRWPAQWQNCCNVQLSTRQPRLPQTRFGIRSARCRISIPAKHKRNPVSCVRWPTSATIEAHVSTARLRARNDGSGVDG
jgi:hypothetical protein